MLARGQLVVNNDNMTTAVWQELLDLATAADEAAERAGAISRVRANDIQLTAVKENTSALKARVLELAEADGA